MKVYRGTQTEHGPAVQIEENGEYRSLDPRHDLRNLSPEGFGWGSAGAGPSQLALALAADVLGDDKKAIKAYPKLRYTLVGPLPDEGWMLGEEQVKAAVEAILREQPRGRNHRSMQATEGKSR
jgi:hypothetical protein